MLTFGDALEALKIGMKIKRQPWVDEYLVLVEYGNQGAEPRKAGVVRLDDGEFKVLYSYIALSTDELFMPWSPTHVDILEEDWIML